MDTKQSKNELLRPDHELPAPHDMQLDPGYDDELPSGASAPKSSGGKRSFPLWIFPLIAFLLVALAGGMYFLGQQKSNQQPVAQTNIPTPTVTPTPDPMAGWKTFTNETKGYSLKYPASLDVINWDKYEDKGTSVAFCDCPPGGKDSGAIIWSMTIEILPLSKYKTIENYISSSYKLALKDILLQPTTVATIPAKRMKLDKELPYSAYSVPTDNIYFIKDNSIYSIIRSVPEITDDDFEKMLQSFKFSESSSASSSAPNSQITETQTMCTMDAKICPDGSSVSRTGPKCEFAACPQ